jgi:hypothetical protein
MKDQGAANERDFQVDEGLYHEGNSMKDQDISSAKDEQDYLEFFPHEMKVGGQGISSCLENQNILAKCCL